MKKAVLVEHPGLSNFRLEKKMEASRQEIEKWGMKGGKNEWIQLYSAELV